ncbi:sensor histidine kinase [Saccharothrix syringae]|uniref:histidine kinase n=1 Tax=Saccharothrix syringae TaxID=103733 RepID=A0A5Q0GSZ2_SACSY|nr:sensor histidine kinase [Saccharothrix syringae]QFZ16584.1 sensor histidine kinase [Saccharothrix syringae]
MRALLKSVWDEPRPPGPPPRSRTDVALVCALVAGAVLEGLFRPDLPWRLVPVLLTVALAPTLLWRRTRPLPVVVVAFGGCALVSVLLGVEPELNSTAFMLLLVHALVRWGAGREIVLGLAVVLARIGLSAVLGRLEPTDALGGLVVLGAVGALAAASRYRSGARSRELERAKLLERERLARDLHDTVAHHVSAMAIRAQAGLAVAATRPDAASEALRVIEAEASRALTEMRAIVRVLRDDRPAELSPNPTVADLVRLADGHRAGPVVDVRVDGDVDDLPAPVGTAVYRLAQESVTNALRHARRATRVEVRVTADDTSVRLRVTDDGEAGPVSPSGYGLHGMTERAGLLGGTCEAGPGPGGGWTVTAVLPRGGAGR